MVHENNYLNSKDFKLDSDFWKNHLLDVNEFVKFYNIKSNNVDSKKINLNNKKVSIFLNNYNTSKFYFITAVFSLYLSKIDNTKGCVLKTNIENVHTLLKVDYVEDISFKQHLNNIEKAYDEAVEHTKINIENYVGKVESFYSIHNLNNNLNDNNDKWSVLSLNIHDDYLELSYNSDLFTDVYIEHMLANIEHVINFVLDYPDITCKDIEIISKEEKILISNFCRGKEIDVDNNKTLAMAFREHALNNPEVIAVDDGINQVTYDELHRSSNSIAYDLRNNHGISHGDKIALMLPRTYLFPELVLALNKIGAVFIPIDMEYPFKRIEHMLNISESSHIITTKEHAKTYDFNIDLICIEDLKMCLDAEVECIGNGDDLFAILFTSGTTGLPKPVMFVNKQIGGGASFLKNLYKSSPGDMCGCYASFSFIVSFRLYFALYFGEGCRIFNEKEHNDSLLLMNALKNQHLNDLILPPTLGLPIYKNENLNLKYLMVAGSKVNDFPKKEDSVQLINLYGTTETLISISSILNDENDYAPIGKPLNGNWAYILDKNYKQLPIGVPGEIYVSSEYISPGYYNNLELTNESFIDNPYTDCKANSRMYRTGDIGFYNFKGEIEIIGRDDDQLSVRGFRVETNEILKIMKDFEAIDDIYLDVDNENLIVYYTTDDDLDINHVNDALKSELPPFMIPSHFIELDEIPLNPNGKVDRFALRKNSQHKGNTEIDDEILECVVDAFKEVLNIDFVSIDDDFVALGGNSLFSMNLQWKLKVKLGVNVYINEILELSTPENIANYIKLNLNNQLSSEEINYSFSDICPLSESQLNIYLDEMVNDMGTAYNIPYKIRFNQDYSIDEINNAINKLFEKYPILKARIITEKGTLPSCIFDAEPEIKLGNPNDIESFVQPFEFDKALSRFLIVKDENTLCCDFHHLIFDGSSFNIILDTLGSILNNEDFDSIDDGFLKQISFEENIDSSYMHDAQEFIDSMLTDRDEVHDLLPEVSGNEKSVYQSTFDIDNSYFKSFLQSHSITENQLFASVFAYTLSRFTGSSKVLFNIIGDGRGYVNLSNSVGMFAKTLPVLIDCKNQNIDSFLDYSSNLINSVMKYDLYPFYVLTRDYDLNSDILFQYSHNLFNNFTDFNVDELDHDPDCDLSFNIFNSGDGFGIKVSYSDVYSKDLIERLSASFKAILHEIMQFDDLSQINYTSDSDIKILNTYNQTEAPLVYDDVLDAFNDNLSKYPNNKLVSSRDISYSYGESAFIADKIAKSLKNMGVESQNNVAFLVDRSELYMFCVLGIMSCGAVYVPLDDSHPDERIKYMIEDTNSKVIIASDETYDRVNSLSDKTIVLNISDIIKEDIKSLSYLPIDYCDLACILYTSGTTGLPKGVKITRKAILNFVEYYVNESNMDNDAIYGLFASIGFDVAIKGIFSSIYSGACLNIIPEDIKLNIGKLNKYFDDYGVTHTHITTPVAKLFINSCDEIPLTELVTGGEKLGKIVNPPNCRFIDTYGPTEACVYVTSINDKDKIDSSSVGHLLNNLKAYILDDNLNRVPCGAVGELYLTGYQIADGYLNLKEETERAFLKNPFDENKNYSIMYRTGDIARFLPDGSIDIVGRRDSQVKIRGNRVELSEIEVTIRQLDYIEDVTVQYINKELVAYVTLNRNLNDDALQDLISEHIRENKPDYMVPSFVISLDSIPLTVNGKVNKRELPEIDFERVHGEYVAATNENEELIVEAFENVFSQEKIGIYDDFVRLGGDSLTAIKLISYLEDFNISAADILSLRTPKAIAESITVKNLNLDIYSVDACPLNESQLNIYLDIVANNKIDSYLIPLYINISRDYALEEIHKALKTMFDVHPILKMKISNKFDIPYLIKGDEPPISVDSNANDETIKKFMTKPFNLDENLCRFLIVENNDGYDFFAIFHHLIFDALSSPVFKQDLLNILDGKTIDVDDSFLKVSAFNQQIQNSEEYDKAEMFFDSNLVDIDDVDLLLPCIESDGQGIAEIVLNFDFDLFKTFLNRNTISENVLFTSVFAYTLSRFVSSDKVLFNIVENGRDRFNNFNSIGMYVNTLPILVDCKNQDTTSFVRHMSDLVYNVMRYNYYPFKELANKYDINSNILFQFMPDWFDNDNETMFNDIIEDMDDLITDFDVNVIQKDEMYKLRIVYSAKYSKDTVQRFMESYRLILQEILCADKLGDINYVSKSDLECLDEINQTESDLMYNDVLDAFNDNLAKYPNNNLVSFNDKIYSYAEGAFIANEISNCLKDIGVEKHDNIAFLVECSELYMFCILGILSAGAVYVPLDDAHPNNRIQLILDDVDARIVISSDETYERVKYLINDNTKVLNISDIINEDIGHLSKLPVVYDDLACILYTSGTTGVPKGVKITRKAILNLAEFYIKKYNLTKDDVYGLFASIGFDVAIKAIFPSICAGSCLAVVPSEIKLDMIAMNNYFIKHEVTHTEISTQVAKLFIDQVDYTPLKVLTTGGEKLGDNKFDVNYCFVDSYGPSEACVDVTSINVNAKIHNSSVGYLLNNIKAYVLDDEKRRVPIGAVGELYLSGYQIADGYLNRNEETEKAFISNPFDEGDYGIMYRTGDMVRILPDKSLGLVGRRDKQVKVRGNRVELSEVETVIREINFIDDVTVQTIKNKSNYELIAYVVVNEELNDIDLKNQISSYVSSVKPDYMVPSFVVQLDKIPLSVNGKVDKRALPKVDLDTLSTEYVPPTTEYEKQIANAFKVVFNRESIGLFDDFLHLGGDSITAIRVISLLREKEIFCIARDILNYKTPYLIAQHVNENIDNVSYNPVEGAVDLHPIQKYFFNQININNYTQEFVLKANMNLDINILQRAFDELTNVHDMLRAVYKFAKNKVIQEILQVNTHIFDIKEHIITDNLNDALLNIIKESVKTIDMENHLIDVNLIRYKNQSYISIVCHHLIIDGVSWNALLTDLTYIYFRLVAGKKIKLTRPYPYKNWIKDVKELVENISDEEKQHWIEINNLLDDSNIKGSANVFALNIDAKYDVDNLLGLSEEEYLALAIARAYKKTYNEDIIFNHEAHGRDDSLADVSRTIGWFTSEYPILVKINNGYDNISLMNDVYSIKRTFNNINNLGLNYASLIYTTHELEYKHCPVTFNFLSKEFVFKNKLFESMNLYLSKEGKIDSERFDFQSYGVTFNISHEKDSYIIVGNYAGGTYIGNEFNTFVENIESELEFISNYSFENEGIVCCLTEEQLGVYLDEKVHDKGTAYASTGILECNDNSIDEIKNAIKALINKHPILKGRVLITEDIPLLICDNDPIIEVINDFDYSTLVQPFDLNKSLASFFIVDDDEKFVFYHIHHIITDATSDSVIYKDFERALNNKLNDVVDFGFIHASIDAYESKFKPEYKSALEFYKNEFVDIDEVQYLLNDIDGCTGKVSLPIRGVRKRIERFAHKRGITTSNILNAVFAYTYSRFTGSEKVYFTFTEHGRHKLYSDDALGMFVRTIPIIVDCKNKSINDYMDYVSDLILESMSNSIYPFRLLASEFNLNNDVSFEYNYDLNDVSDIGDDIIFSDKADRVSEFSCVVNDLDDGYLVGVNHSDNFSQITAKRFVMVFKEVLIQCLDKENLKDIDYISNEDIGLLDSYNHTETLLMYNDVLDAFNDNLAKYPDNNLVSFNDKIYSYAEGAFIANEISNCLKDIGVEKHDNIAFLVEHSELYLFCILGILSSGAAYVPLDDAHPDNRIQLILDDIDARVVISSDETYGRVKYLIDDNTEVLNISDITNKDIGSLTKLPVVYDDLACILYTSGTTGVPKGVKITRKAMMNFIEFYIKDSTLNSDDVFAMYSSIGFDVGAIKSILSPACCGACLDIIPQDIKLNINKLNEHFIKNKVTHTNITTQVAKLFIENVKETTLKVLVAGGEKLGDVNAPNDYRFIDNYGPTEFCVSATNIDVCKKIDSTSIGHLLNNTKGYILDKEYRRVPIGAVGELYLSGYQIADGYLNRDKETKKAFIPNPFDEGDYSIMYRTGDMVRILPDESLGLVGRRDKQVKVRGNRVELSEVETVIRELDYVEDVTVQTIKNHENHELIAYVVTSENVNNLKEKISDYVSELKPSYMVPSFVMKLDEIPLTVNGKVDYQSLPKVDLNTLSAEYVPPSNETEKHIVDAFEKVFNREKISVNDDFIRLGGDSLTAIRLLSYIGDYNVTAADILSLHTPHAIANNINAFEFDLDIYSLETGCPLNEAQLNVYLDIKANDKLNTYTLPLSMDISKKFNAEDIKITLNTIFNVHPILRMCVSDEFEVPYLIKGSDPSVIIETNVDNDFIVEFFTKEFDLENSLCRFLIIENDDVYTLFAIFHHLIFDALSVDMFKDDLLSALEGKSIPMDDSFLKSSAFSQQIQNTEEFSEASEFYESMLVDSEECNVLLDGISSNQSGIFRTELELDLDLFKSFLHNHGISENVVFTTAFAYTLSRFVGSSKVKFNIIENGRDRFNNLNSIGMYVNTLPILMNCKNQNVSDFMEYSANLIYNVMKYNYYPFRLLATKYDIDSNILFQFIPNWIKSDETADANELLHDLMEDRVNLEDSITDLNVNIFQKGNNYQLSVLYSEKYSKEIIERFTQSYNLILSQLIKVNELSDINYVTKSDLDILDNYNQTEHDLEYDDILEAFNDNLAKYPNNNLVSMDGIGYSYGEGAFIANKIAEKLKTYGVKEQDCVAFLTERSQTYMMSVLGIMSAGAVYVPLDDALPNERVEFILNDTQAKVIIASDETFKRVSELNTVANILNISDFINNEVGTLSKLPISYGDLACILYTSGSTGIPKGVKITRKSVLNLSACYSDDYGLTNNDVYGLFSNIGFDAGSWGILTTIYAGACLEIIPEEIRLDIDAMNEYFIQYNVTHAFMTTQVGKLFAERIKCTSLNLLCVGGEKLGEFESQNSYDLADFYGPTEAYIYVASNKLKDKIDYSSVGNLNYNTKIYILDEEFRRVPIGGVGELYISGYQIADGYLNRDKETNNQFLNNPFTNDENYDILYRTGDIVQLLPDGSLGIIGRSDSQVKIRGNRVELSEIESVIREIEYIDDVTVQTVKNDTNNEIVAYVVVNQEYDDIRLKETVCNYVARFKPNYMIPAFVIDLNEIPLNVNGKVDKSALPEVDFDNIHVEYVAPTNDDEKTVVEAFEKVFNQENIGIRDDFIHLGGDSLTAIKLVSHLKDYNISVADVLQLHTPKIICQNIKKINTDLNKYSMETGCPLNEPQLNVYLDIIANNKSNSYQIPLALEIPNDFNSKEISNALKDMVKIHPILGMCISEDYEVPYLIKGSKPSIIVKRNASDEFINDFLQKSFDLQDSLSRFLIVEDNDKCSIFAVFHHLIFDALSDGIFRRDLESILKGENVDVDDIFLKVSTFNQEIKDSDEYIEANKFYNAMLADYDYSMLLDSVSSEGAGICRKDLELDNNAFKTFLDKHGVSENVVFVSAFAYTLSRFVGSDKVLFNMHENGRDRFSNYDSIGMHVTTLPILADCKNQDIDSFIEHMSKTVYGVMKYNYYPFRLLANEYDIDSNISFQYLPEWIGSEDKEFNKIEFSNDMLVENVITDFGVDIVQNGENYSITIGYSEKYSKDLIEHFIESYKSILLQLINVNNLSEINYTSDSDIELLNTYNHTETPLIYNDVLDAFNDNLAKYPDNKLVSSRDIRYSYSESAFIADNVAKSLKNMGVKSQDNVAFLVERSELYMFCVLGIMSCGAVYVPLDDSHPDERIKYMIEDTNSKVIIASDETYNRANSLSDETIVLNISNLIKDNIGQLSSLEVSYNDLACILYTSGTTGLPKGVKITRKAILNFVAYYINESNMDNNSTYGLFASIGFDVAIKGIFSSIYSGACLNIIPDDIKLNMGKLNEYYDDYDVTHTHITTQVAKLFINSCDEIPLTELVTGGEKLGEIVNPLNCRFVDTYGPTEACVYVTSIDEEDKIAPSSVGHLLNNIKAYILDNNLNRVPCGAVGELFLSGYQIADGYLNRDEETKNTFLNNPFEDNEDYNIMYRTGDMARFLPDGSIDIVGRRDNQIKVRGNRVELSEVESIIRHMSAVKDVTVQSISNNGNNELVAYVTLSNDLKNVNLRNYICDYVNKNKPSYMVPSYVVRLDEIPLTVNGKVDKRALPNIDFNTLNTEYVAPENKTESFFVKCFEEILNIDKVGATDNFFEMGGDSLLVIKIIMEALNNGYSINYEDVFDNPTPRLLSKVISTDEQKHSLVEDNYDYSSIDDLLKKKNIDSFNKGEYAENLGNVLLTGSTGFLGIHILNELFEKENGTIYCLIRANNNQTPKSRLKSAWNYYFNKDFSEFENRVHVIEGDITNPDDFKKLSSYNIDTIINSAANVKHYAQGSELKDINFGGTVNALEFAKTKDARFIQVSTASVAGERVNNIPPKEVKLYETDLFINQIIDNKYVESKFLAERKVLESAIDYDLDVKIMRVGNLMARSYDGLFQRNYDTNAFINNLKSFVTIGKMPLSFANFEVGFSAIDITAKSIISLSKTPKGCCIFHPFTNKQTTYRNVVDVLNSFGLNIELCDEDSFNKSLNEIFNDKTKHEGIFGLVTRLNNSEVKYEYILADNDYTSKLLLEFGVKWPEINEKYLHDFIKLLIDLDFFKI